MYYNPDIPLETALELFEDPHVRYEIIEDYYEAYRSEQMLRIMGDLALEPGVLSDTGHIILGYD